MVIDTVGRSRYNILGGDDIDVDLASYLLAAWDFGNGKQLLQEPIELRTRLYELFLRKATEYKEEFNSPWPMVRGRRSLSSTRNLYPGTIAGESASVAP